MDRELTLHPEKQQTRDLTYSEYSSCDRSVHLLIQESASVPYEILLRIYRETVSAYLSSEEIRPPEDFIGNLLTRFDGLADTAGLPLDNWQTLGVHLLLRAKNDLYIVTSRESEVLLRAGGSLAPAGEACDAARLRFDRGAVQRELFPSRLGDLLSVLKLDAARLKGGDLVLGCPEAERAAVLDGLSNPVWLDPDAGADLRASRRSIVSTSVSRRILVLNLGGSAAGAVRPAGAPKAKRRIHPLARRVSVRTAIRLAAVLGAAAVAGILWTRIEGERAAREQRTPEPFVAGEPRAGEDPPSRAQSPARTDRNADWRLTEAWRRRFAAPVTSSPVLAGGKVIFGCRDGAVYALDPESGATLWTFKASGGVGASPAAEGESVIVADYNGYVFSLAVSDGNPRWKTKLATSVVSSPAVNDGRVLVCGTDGYAYCLSARDGAIGWKRKTMGRIRGSAAATDHGFLVPSYDGHLYSLSAVLGSVSWRFALGGAVSASPAARDGSVVIGGVDGRVRCLSADDGALKWNFAAGGAVKSSLAISGDAVLFGSNDGCLYCLDLSSGALRWKYQTGGLVLARPVERDGVVYAGSYDGRMYGLGVDDGRPVGAFEAGAEIFSSPAVDDEKVYFGTNGGEFMALRRRSG